MFDYICSICGATFEQDRNDYHVYYGCPYCGQDVERAEPCEVCGKLIPKSQNVYRRCKAHKAETRQKFKAFIEELTAGELAYLEDKTDGIEWKKLKEVV